MNTLRAAISAITLFAFAVNPLAAAFRPCCCTRQVESVPTCCQTRAALAETKFVPTAANQTCCVDVKIASGGCCCVQAAPATIAAPKDVVNAHSQEFSLTALRCDARHVSRAADFLPLRGRLTLSGPPLLALYCHWLK